MVYDYIVIGAGIAGACTAFFLEKAGFDVLVIEKGDIASGGSGAAGAFISPRLGRGGPLQKVTNEAFRYSIRFYQKHTKEHFFSTGLLRLPKDDKDAEKFKEFEKFIDVDYKRVYSLEYPLNSLCSEGFGGFFFEDAAIVEAKRVCESLLKSVKTVCGYEVKELRKDGDLFIVGSYRSKGLILATGAENHLLPPYIRVSPLGGVRLDISFRNDLPFTVHKKVSVSKEINGKTVLGATHTRFVGNGPVLGGTDARSLISNAKACLNMENIDIKGLFCGVRSSVNDHMPMVGEIVDLNGLKKGSIESPPEELPRVDNLYYIGAFGGRGFVFAPFLAKILTEFITTDTAIDKRVVADRYLYRYLKRKR